MTRHGSPMRDGRGACVFVVFSLGHPMKAVELV